jgi:hypothetical protein
MFHIFDGRALVDGSTPWRPHVLVFNSGDDDLPTGNNHAVLASLPI